MIYKSTTSIQISIKNLSSHFVHYSGTEIKFPYATKLHILNVIRLALAQFHTQFVLQYRILDDFKPMVVKNECTVKLQNK